MAVDLGLLVQIGLVVGVAFLMFRGGCCGRPAWRSPARRVDAAPARDGVPTHEPVDPFQVLKVRLARGEINADEYERLRRRLISQREQED